jgi:ribonuclease BN (tRNA processing enzyme)
MTQIDVDTSAPTMRSATSPAMRPAMRVTILGSGTCVPSLVRSSCAVLVEVGANRILVDAGPGTMRRLLEAGTTIFDLSHLLISHLHPDHTGELVPLLFATKYPDGTRRQHPLEIVAGQGFSHFFNGLKGIYGNWIELPEPLFTIREMRVDVPDSVQLGVAPQGGTVSLVTRPMAHSPESVGFRIQSPGGPSVVYSGDTDLTPDLVALARDADLLICECAMPDGEKVPGHLTPSEAGRMATEAAVGHLVLTHFYPECEAVDLTAQCRRTYAGALTLAQDLLTLVIGEKGVKCTTIPST